jgi:hypothetical protein
MRHLKVVNSENDGEVIAYGKWEIYRDRRPDLDKLRRPQNPGGKEDDQYRLLRGIAHEYFCARNGEMGQNPHMRKFELFYHGLRSAC